MRQQRLLSSSVPFSSSSGRSKLIVLRHASYEQADRPGISPSSQVLGSEHREMAKDATRAWSLVTTFGFSCPISTFDARPGQVSPFPYERTGEVGLRTDDPTRHSFAGHRSGDRSDRDLKRPPTIFVAEPIHESGLPARSRNADIPGARDIRGVTRTLVDRGR